MADSETPLHVLFVCTANICRSPYAQLRTEQAVGDAISVASAGLRGFDGNPMDDEMAAQLRMRGGNPSGFLSRPLSGRSFVGVDLVLTLESDHRRVIVETWPSTAPRVFAWKQFVDAIDLAPGESGIGLVHKAARIAGPARRAHDIPDPFGRGTPAAAVCAIQLDRLLQTTLSALLGRPVSV